ncbi:hypothetical protein [Acinetobacter baumannii]|uniref:hypothetical protein n=1 Tax=Acinetobacter baumannii TaxID=470 RepID=UPI0026D7F2D5
MKEKVFSDWYHQTRDITARAGFDAAWQHQQAKVEELKATIKGNHGRIAELERLNRVKAQAIIDLHQEITELKASHHGEVIGHEVHLKKIKQERDELQKRVDELERKLQIKTRHCEFYEQSRNGHRSLAIHRKKQINSALEQIEKLYSKAENDYEKDRNPYYDGMLSALDLAEQAIRGELEEQALKGDQYDEHRKKAEEAISKGASLTSHRIEL